MSVLRNEKQLVRFEYDFAVDGGAIGDITLRPDVVGLKEGMIVTDMIVRSIEALASDGSATVTVGDGTDVDAFFADQFGSLDANNDIVRDGTLALEMGAGASLTLSVGVADLTAGKLEVYAECISK